MGMSVLDGIGVFCIIFGSILLAGGVMIIGELLHAIILFFLGSLFYGCAYFYLYGVYKE